MSKKRKNSLFAERVFSVVRNIPKGEVLSYKNVAIRAGNPGAYRAVGTLMRKNCDKTIPCHRVIKSDGSLGGFNRGTEKKKTLLRREGVKI